MTKAEATAKARQATQHGYSDDGKNTYAFCPDCGRRVYGYYMSWDKRPKRVANLRAQLVEHLLCGCEDGWGTTR
jgi:hypothetical protein